MCVCVCACVCGERERERVCVCVCVFTNGPRDRSSIPGRVIKTQKMLLDASLLNTQHYKSRVKDKWSNPGKGAELPTLGVVAIKKKIFGSPSTMVCQLIYIYIYIFTRVV